MDYTFADPFIKNDILVRGEPQLKVFALRSLLLFSTTDPYFFGNQCELKTPSVYSFRI